MAKKKTSENTTNRKTINLALQGGGAHGAFAWGVIDYLLEDGRIDIEGVSATSAGAMNAAVLAQGMLNNDKEEARQTLTNFWKAISDAGERSSPFKSLMPSMPWQSESGDFGLENSPFYIAFDFLSRVFSPYQFNPMNFNPLRDVLLEHVDFDDIQKRSKLKLHICATNVETCKVRIFDNKELSVNAVLASACLPFLFQSVEVDGEYYWDGGYIGNPAIFPLIYHCDSQDVMIVHINPIIRKGVPTSAAEILNRLNEVSFNSSLMREMRAIAFVSKLLEEKKVKESDMKAMYIHSVRSDDEMSAHSVSSKLNTDWRFLTYLRDRGREVTKQWLAANYNKIGRESSVNIQKEFL